MSFRGDGRQVDELRSVSIVPDYNRHAEGSALIECGNTRVICTASVENKVPPFLRGTGQGWITSEYGMIPRSTSTRMIRESSKGKPSGRTQEIQRLIGRSLRSVVDMDSMGERTIWVDCDVIQADGGTRTAAITGSFVALALAVAGLRRHRVLSKGILFDLVAAVSVGIVDKEALLDLNYEEDSAAEVDMNVVMTGRDLFVEVQGTAEGQPYSQDELSQLLQLAQGGIQQLIEKQREILEQSIEDTSLLFQEEVETVQVAAPSGDKE